MKRHLAVLAAAIVASAPALAHAQQTLPSLPPPPPPPPVSAPAAPPPAPPPPAPPTAQAQGEVTYDGTAVAPSTTTVPAPYAAPPPVYPEPPLGPCGGPGAYTHDGFYLRFTSGIGYYGMSGTGPGGVGTKLTGVGSTGRLAIGGTPARGLVLGGAFGGASSSDMDISGFAAGAPGHGWNGASGSLSGFADWFPNVHQGWHVGAALGLAGLMVTNPASQTTWNGAAGTGQVFGGYDMWLGPEWSLGLQADIEGTSRADMQDGNQRSVGYQLGAYAFAIEATLLHH